MKTQFPTQTGCSGIFLAGQRKAPDADIAQPVAVFVLKRYYRISAGQLIPEPDSTGLRISDEMVSFSYNSVPYSTASYQSDIAVYKPYADLIVRNYYTPGDSCSVHGRVDGAAEQLWLERSGAVTNNAETGQPDPDLLRHMFGFENRALAPRRHGAAIQINDNPVKFAPPVAAPVFNNAFFNGYRRCFARPGYPFSAFGPNSQLRISRSGHSPLQFTLGAEQISARLWLADNNRRDTKRYWCRHPITTIRADTLVVSPDELRAYILWRGFWPYEQFAPEHCRQLDVTLQEQH